MNWRHCLNNFLEDKVILVKPCFGYVYGKFAGAMRFFELPPPTGLLAIAAVLEKNALETVILDAEVEKYGKNETLEFIFKSRAKIVGFSTTTPEINYILSLAKKIKASRPDVIVAVGGPHAIARPKEIIGNDSVDAVCSAEGETAFTEYVKRVFSNGLKGDPIVNLYYKYGSKIVGPPSKVHYENLDSLPFQPLHRLDYTKYKYPAPAPIRRVVPYTSLMTTRGCPYACTFCSRSLGSRVRVMTAERVVGEIEFINRDYGISFFG